MSAGFSLPKITPLCDRSAADKAAAQAQDAASHRFLRELCKLPCNQECADCTAKNPGWATLPHGAFICIDCAQIHRHIGRHISQVKAINTGTYLWYPDEVKAMQLMGNDNVRAYYLGGGPPDVRALKNKPAPQDSRAVREQYIRDKYEHKRWLDPRFSLAAPRSSPAAVPAAPAAAAPVAQPQPDLIGLFSSMTTAAPVAPAAPVATAAPTTDFWGGYGLPPSQPQVQPQQGYEQSKASILALFDAPQPAPIYSFYPTPMSMPAQPATQTEWSW